MNEKHDYDDIIDLPRFVSKNRPHMSDYDRAAQFAPFAALTGYGETIREAARMTEPFREPGDTEKEILDISDIDFEEESSVDGDKPSCCDDSHNS